jgi:hypothetical protein
VKNCIDGVERYITTSPHHPNKQNMEMAEFLEVVLRI